MTTIEPINYKYFGIAIVFLLLTYYYLSSTKDHIYKKEIYNKKYENVKIKTKNGNITMDPNIFEMHMLRTKDNIVFLQKNFNPKKCDMIKKYLENAKNHIKKYIHLNTENINDEFCDFKTRFKLVDDNLVKEREMLKNKLSNKTLVDYDDKEEVEDDNIRYAILELLIDIDIILFLIRSSLCKKGEMDLSVLDQIIMELYRNNCINKSSKDFKHSMDNIIHYSINPDASVFMESQPEKISRSVPSQDIDDTKTHLKKETFKNRKKENNPEVSLSHATQKDFCPNELRMGKLLKNADYNNQMIEWYRQYDILKKSNVDKNCRTSLFN